MPIPVLYIAPWVDHGGTDKATVDWFRSIDRERFEPSLITTQPSSSRRLADVVPLAREVWPLPDLMAGKDFPHFILDFIHSRGIRVVHVMNSRLAFDLLPAIASLPDPPAVVVQLHVEEDDRSGFVQYVTTRYGNLVDAFSIVSEHLTEVVVRDYEMPRAKCHTIHLGIDAGQEFSPDHAEPVPEVEPGPFNVLYPVRLVTQKDPLTMVAAADALRETGLDFRFHVLGEGHLEPDVRDAIAERGLESHVLLHGSRTDMPGWFAACDALLLTSVYEGVPVAVYEAMAMKLPIVSPRLDAIAEVLDDSTATLLEPGSPPESYAEALAALAANPQLAERQGEAGRERVLEQFTLENMAKAHEQLYEEIAPAEPESTVDCRLSTVDRREPLLFRTRPSRGTPLVSAVIPCYDQGRFLRECLASIRAQTYPSIETIVVDDASSDPETRELVDELEAGSEVTVVRMERNSGPGAARNAGIDRAHGRYVLPVDADNLLPADAVERLVEQLQGAGEKVGFIYPCIQYFGTRDDYFEPPLYNLYGLLQGNYCDTGSLIDREVFDAGLRFLEEPRMAHEDWDFFLKLAALDVRGEPSLGEALRARKHGFTRSDTITFGEDPRETRLRHPELYGDESDPLGPLEVKRRWSPALSIVALGPADADREALERHLATQSCADAELIVRADDDWAAPRDGPFVRRIPTGVASTRGEALADAAELARGRVVYATAGTGAAELADRAFAEKLLRVFEARQDLHAIAFADAPGEGVHPWRPIAAGAGEPHAVAWRATQPQRLPEPMPVAERHPIAAVVRAYAHNAAPIQWRHLPAPAAAPDAPEPEPLRRADVRLRGTAETRPRQQGEKERRMRAEPLLPGVPRDWLPNFTGVLAWSPPETVLLHRFVDDATGTRIVSDHGEPPDGYRLEYWLGAANRFARPGTTRLTAIGDPVPHHYRTIPWDEPWKGPGPDERVIGNIEMPERPMLDQVFLAEHRETGQRVLVAGDDDPIANDVEKIVSLGWIEAYPSNPRRAPAPAHAPFGVVGLMRAVDRERRRHVYGAGEVPEGDVAGELGALLDMPERDTVPVWITGDGRLLAGDLAPERGRAGLRDAARWTLAPAAWEGFATPQVRARAVGRRSLSSLRHLAARRRRAAPNGNPPAGWLYSKERPVTILDRELLPLYSWTHPVTRDQFLSTKQLEGGDLGYGEPTLLGWLLPEAPITGMLATERKDIPWASRFGQNVRA